MSDKRGHMSERAYASMRKSLGTQANVGFVLGVHPTTLSRRENGTLPITSEAELALRYLSAMVHSGARPKP